MEYRDPHAVHLVNAPVQRIPHIQVKFCRNMNRYGSLADMVSGLALDTFVWLLGVLAMGRIYLCIIFLPIHIEAEVSIYTGFSCKREGWVVTRHIGRRPSQKTAHRTRSRRQKRAVLPCYHVQNAKTGAFSTPCRVILFHFGQTCRLRSCMSCYPLRLHENRGKTPLNRVRHQVGVDKEEGGGSGRA